MRSFVRPLFLALGFTALAGVAGAQQKATLPYDHIHLNVPADEGSAWYETHFGGIRIEEAPNRIRYGAVRLMFLGRTNTGSSDGSVIEHIGFSVADLDAKMRELAAINTKVIEPPQNVPNLYRTALIEDPWGTRIQIVQDPELLGLHHMQLRAPDPEAVYTWLLDKFGGERTKIKGQLDSVRYSGVPGFSTVYILVARGESVPSQGRAIDHIGWRSPASIDATKAMLEGKGVTLTTQPRPLNLAANKTTIHYFYVAGPNGARIEIVERPGIEPGK